MERGLAVCRAVAERLQRFLPFQRLYRRHPYVTSRQNAADFSQTRGKGYSLDGIISGNEEARLIFYGRRTYAAGKGRNW